LRNTGLSTHCTYMSFSLSTFTVEIDGTPTGAFQAKWHAEADEICRGWVNLHSEEISAQETTRRPRLAPVIKVRLAFATEKSAYEAASDDTEFYGGVKIVKLIDTRHRDETDAGVATEDVSDEPAAEQDADTCDNRNSDS